MVGSSTAPRIGTRGSVVVLLLAAALFTGVPGAQAASGAPQALSLVGSGDPPLVVKLHPSSKQQLKGSLNFQVKSPAAGHLRVRVFPDEGRSAVQLRCSATPAGTLGAGDPGAPSCEAQRLTQGVNAWLAEPRGSRLDVRAGSITRVSMALTLAKDVPVTSLAGLVVVDLSPPAGKAAAGPLSFRMAGSLAPPPDVAFVPSAITLSVTRLVRLTETEGATAPVVLRGDGVEALKSELGGRPLTTVLHADNGGSAKVQLVDLQVVDGEGRATLEATDITKEGKYEGDLPLVPAADSSPALAVTIKAHEWFWLGVATLFAGAIAGLIVTRLLRLHWRRGAIEAGLTRALQRYSDARKRYSSVQTWRSLEYALGEEPWYGPGLKCEEFPSDLGAANLVCRIRQASNDNDLGDDEILARDYVGRTQRWIWLAPKVRDLLEESEKELPPRVDGTKFDATITYADVQAVLLTAEEEQDTKAKMEAFGNRLGEQTSVLAAAGRVWKLQCELEPEDSGISDEARAKLPALDVKVLEARANPDKPPTIKDLKQLRKKLARAATQLEAMRPAAAEEEGLNVSVFLEKAGDAAHALKPSESRITSFLVAIPAKLWAPLRGILRAGLRVTRAEWVSTLLAALAATIAYMLTVYNDTWGSSADYLSAFTVGFFGKFGFDWGTQLIFRSRRLGSTGGTESPAPAVSEVLEKVAGGDKHAKANGAEAERAPVT
jgi:hypothetical protein